MDPQIVLSRGYMESASEVLKQWISAYKEIAKKHLMLVARAQKMIKRIELASSLCVTHATFFNSGNVDECFYGEAVAKENEFLKGTQKARESLDGDFPCGNEEDMRFARRFFSIREMANLQMGLARELNPDDLSQVPPVNKSFADEAFPRKIKASDQPLGRKGFIHECLGNYQEAIDCYEAFSEGRPDERIDCLRKKLS